jgi:hypothetical protein
LEVDGKNGGFHVVIQTVGLILIVEKKEDLDVGMVLLKLKIINKRRIK